MTNQLKIHTSLVIYGYLGDVHPGIRVWTHSHMLISAHCPLTISEQYRFSSHEPWRSSWVEFMTGQGYLLGDSQLLSEQSRRIPTDVCDMCHGGLQKTNHSNPLARRSWQAGQLHRWAPLTSFGSMLLGRPESCIRRKSRQFLWVKIL